MIRGVRLRGARPWLRQLADPAAPATAGPQHPTRRTISGELPSVRCGYGSAAARQDTHRTADRAVYKPGSTAHEARDRPGGTTRSARDNRMQSRMGDGRDESTTPPADVVSDTAAASRRVPSTAPPEGTAETLTTALLPWPPTGSGAEGTVPSCVGGRAPANRAPYYYYYYYLTRATSTSRRARHLVEPPRRGERRAPRWRAGAASAAARGRRLGGAARTRVRRAVAHEHLGPADESTSDATRDGDIDGHERRAEA